MSHKVPIMSALAVLGGNGQEDGIVSLLSQNKVEI